MPLFSILLRALEISRLATSTRGSCCLRPKKKSQMVASCCRLIAKAANNGLSRRRSNSANSVRIIKKSYNPAIYSSVNLLVHGRTCRRSPTFAVRKRLTRDRLLTFSCSLSCRGKRNSARQIEVAQSFGEHGELCRRREQANQECALASHGSVNPCVGTIFLSFKNSSVSPSFPAFATRKNRQKTFLLQATEILSL
jgi:hypothetical protein